MHASLSPPSDWYERHDDPIALIRAETREKLRWATPLLKDSGALKVLDVDCGAGFACNALAARGFQMVGIDASDDALKSARQHDMTGTVKYVKSDPGKLPFDSVWFDAVIALDFLESAADPLKSLCEISRVLKPGGLFLFHSFNRNPWTWFVVRQVLERRLRRGSVAPLVSTLFHRPEELERLCRLAHFEIFQWQGLRPSLFAPWLKLWRTGNVPEDFEFTDTPSLRIAYCGAARRRR